jgi:drug/metabolite transporter (DMT)-like permease
VSPRASIPAAFTLLCLIWGSTWLAIKFGVESVPPLLSASLRFVIAAGTLLLLTAVLKKALPTRRSEWGVILLVGVLLFTFDYGLIYWGEANGVESGLSAILFATMPLQTAIAAHLIVAGERLTLQKLLGIGLGFGGVVLIFREQMGSAGFEKFFPMAAIVLSAACAATSTAAMKRWAHDIDPFAFNGFAMAIGAVGLAVGSFVAAEPWGVPAWPAGLLPILYLALAGSVVTFVAYAWLLKRVQATSASFIALVTPIVALFLGVAIADEAFRPLDLVGSAVTLGGIYLAMSARVSRWGRGIAPRRKDLPSTLPTDPPKEDG